MRSTLVEPWLCNSIHSPSGKTSGSLVAFGKISLMTISLFGLAMDDKDGALLPFGVGYADMVDQNVEEGEPKIEKPPTEVDHSTSCEFDPFGHLSVIASTPLLSTPYEPVLLTARSRCSPPRIIKEAGVPSAPTRWSRSKSMMFPAASTMDHPVRSMVAEPVLNTSIHSPPGYEALSSLGHGFAMTSEMTKSDGMYVTGPPALFC